MDPKFQTSFIPKKPMVGGQGGAKSPINLFSLLATVLFITALALSGGAYFYQRLLFNQLIENKASLERAKDAFDPDTINEIIRLDTRIETAKKLLDSHIAVTPLFDFISSITLQSVRFRDFTFSYLGEDQIQVQMRGIGQNYASVALQSDLFNEQKSLKNTMVGDVALDPKGIVGFSVSTIIDPSVISYDKSLGSSEAPIEESAGTTTLPQ